ncbi:hypothetical protein [Staphylococcus epidermidis]|uniref:hypothetical protein n=1 Tax=Staphylococcus epidermidis TaxID=1282 RepID=UPI001EF864D8|nr:hypothetical protein [Staphylococcus epidermidis]HCZ3669472.1 hypothetical protein [Staphylococcus aureus]MCG7819725.1 hypothetical protein [Staphylococcus epidermidis]MDH8979382.1 hypothetical protein [Staphylococcus epidermidis]MDH8981719.1 hypothetical protein [Staphylococcus epidermidis]MDH8988712.1 hypothetical protein [Staphylococcus epidermidis]
MAKSKSKPKKERISMTVDRDVAKLIDIIGETVGNGGYLPIHSKSKFFETLIKSFVYQVLNGKDTFVKDVKSMKKTMNENGYDESTFRLVTSDALYKFVEYEAKYDEIVETIDMYNLQIEQKERRLSQLEGKIERLENEVKQKEKNNSESTVKQSEKDEVAYKQANTSNRVKNKPVENNKVDKRKERPKHQYPKVDEVLMLYGFGEELAVFTIDDVENYIEQNLSEKEKKAYDYRTEDDKINITPLVYRLLIKMLNKISDDGEEYDLVYNINEYEEKMEIENEENGKIIGNVEVEDSKAQQKINQKLAEIEEKRRNQEEVEDKKIIDEEDEYIEKSDIEIALVINDEVKEILTIEDVVIEEKISDIDSEFLKVFLEFAEEETNLENLPDLAEEYSPLEEQAKNFRKDIIDGYIPRIYY